MRFRTAALSCTTLLALAACDAGLLGVTRPSTFTAGGEAPARSIYPCGDGYECTEATNIGVETDLSTLERNCQEESCGRDGPAIPVSVTVDARYNYNDVFTVRCSRTNSLVELESTAGCWDCTEGCGGVNCPAGAECITIPGSYGSDCRAFSCAPGWTMRMVTAGFTAPDCQRAVTPPPPPPPGPPAAPITTASTVNGKPSITWSAVSGATSYRIYRQIEWQSAPEQWNEVSATSYSDISTRVSGAPQPWPAWATWVMYYVVSVNASGVESTPGSTHYYPYTAVIPY